MIGKPSRITSLVSGILSIQLLRYGQSGSNPIKFVRSPLGLGNDNSPTITIT